MLVPNCPVCHQTISLVARHLEANGISTVVMGCAKDIVEHAAVPRFLFSDFPLGNSAGKPHDPDSQAFTLELALRVLETAPGPQTTVQSPLRWSADASWKRDYNNVAQMSAEELARRRREFDAQKEIARGIARERGVTAGSRANPSRFRSRRRFTLTRAFSPAARLPHRCKAGKVPASFTGGYPMLDRRQSARDKVIFGGVAKIDDSGATRDCVVRNISESGASLEFSNRQAAERQMSLTIARKGRSFLANDLVARQFRRVGLAFRTRRRRAAGVPDLEERLRRASRKSASCSAASRSLSGEG